MALGQFYHPPENLNRYPFSSRIGPIFLRKSPCRITSPFLAVPPVPHALFSIFPKSLRSSSLPTNLVTTVATLFPFKRSSRIRRSCSAGGNVFRCDGSSQPLLKEASVLYTMPDRFFFLLIGAKLTKANKYKLTHDFSWFNHWVLFCSIEACYHFFCILEIRLWL